MLVFLQLILLQVVCCQYFTPKIQIPDEITLVATGPHGSKLYEIHAEGSTYADSYPLLLDTGRGSSSYEQGYDHGYLLGQKFIDNFNSLYMAMLGDTALEPIEAEIINIFLDRQWDGWLGKQVPQEYLDELKGLSDGGKKAGFGRSPNSDVGTIAKRSIVLANLPGSLKDLKYVFEDERQPIDPAHWSIITKMKTGITCSFFGVFGARTSNSQLYFGRNLDWLINTGIANNKIITVHHPVNGFAHATVGFVGLYGALTGMSAKGITVSEANLESDDISFNGFPWILRLRYIMSYASNLQEALELWKSTNSTVGFNHGIGSGADKTAVVLETMAHSNPVFSSMDEREVQNGGNPRSDAVYRTNHGFDPYTISHYQWNDTNAYQDSIYRYELFPQLLDQYAGANQAISAVEAVNITAIVAGKGQDTVYSCTGPFDEGDNVLSVTYDPAALTVYAAWESNGGAWVTAACNTYLQVDLTSFFSE